jgi:membrane-associated phospholipid phosphatase
MTIASTIRITRQRLLREGGHIDDRALTWLAGTPHGPVRPLLTGIASAADLLIPWAVLSGAWVRSGRHRLKRAALHGWTAIAISALIEDTVKPLVGRSRPDPGRLPPGERDDTHPRTSAFPSGHTAAATAFAVAASRDAPAWRPLLAATAVVTTYSLVYTGRHYATDALAGVVVGTTAGTWVRRRSAPAATNGGAN